MTTLGARLRELRLAKPAETQRQFARRMGIDPYTWSKIEAGRLRPNPVEVTQAASLLGADVDELLALLDAWQPAPPPDPSGAFVCHRRWG